MNYYVYIVRCVDNTLYTGMTNDIKRRVTQHNSTNAGAKYTRARRPVVLTYHAKLKNRSAALSEEMRIKKLSRKQKEELIMEDTWHSS